MKNIVYMIVKFILQLPINSVIGLYTFIIPFPIYEIPFIRESF